MLGFRESSGKSNPTSLMNPRAGVSGGWQQPNPCRFIKAIYIFLGDS
jgi:hypothetical protein